MMQVTIYSTTTCPYCKMLKDYLLEKKVQFTEKLVDQDGVAKTEMLNVSGGFMGVPYIVVTKDDGTAEKIVGFDKGKLDQIIGATQ
jgi:glutaredoxin